MDTKNRIGYPNISLRIMKKEIVIGALCLGVGFAIGYTVGFAHAIKEIVEISSKFIEIDEQLVRDAITQYKIHIGTYIG